MFSPASMKKLNLASKRKARPQAMEITEMPPPSKTRIITKKPVFSKRNNPYKAIHKFKRTYNYGSISTAAATPTLTGWNFSMNDMPGYTELTALFDYYKLTGVLFKMIPYQQTMSNSVGTVNNSLNAPIFYAVDYSDDTAPTSPEAVLEYNDHKISTTYQGFSIYIPNPKFADATSAERGGWVATSNPSLNWYGLKYAIPPTQVICQFYVVVTYYVSCKDPK